MSINKLKSVVRRGVMFGAAFAVVAASFAPASLTFADALNPLTERSLSLSSSSPGWDYKDGSGNSLYAPPNSGANGKKTGNTFSFKVSTNSTSTGVNPTSAPVKAITFQYCTLSAGMCYDPGNNAGLNNAGTIANSAATELAKTSNLDIVSASPSQATLGTYVNTTTGAVTSIPAANSTGNNFLVYYENAPGDWQASAGWTMTTQIAQDGTASPQANQITLVNAAGQGFTAGQKVKIVFFATDTNYITNPGAGAFFVKINTYKDVDTTTTPGTPITDPDDVIDGGVTVANVMNQSIQIQTKVLETMDFSVGVVDPNTLSNAQLLTANGNASHTPCDRILTSMDPNSPTSAVNTLKMGDPSAEYSLSTTVSYSAHSYWRLSSNSSGGATVYYSGNTLSNTVNDKIKAIGATKDEPLAGSEQFGLAMAIDTAAPTGTPLRGYQTQYLSEDATGKPYEYGADSTAAGIAALQAETTANAGVGHPAITATGLDASMSSVVGNPSYHAPQLYPLVAEPNYNDGAGVNNTNYSGQGEAKSTEYAFDETSQQIPVALATESTEVVDCVTAKMRYIANIAATTPAGIYTTKINYIASPQY